MADDRAQRSSMRFEDTMSLITAHRAEHGSPSQPDEYDHYLASEYVDEGDAPNGDPYGHTRLVPLGARMSASSKVSNAATSKPYGFERHIWRSTANTLGPLLVLTYFLFVVYEYYRRPAINDIAPPRAINCKSVFFFWVIISIFILDWGKSAIAGFEAAALMKPRLAPSTAIHLMWHTDRDWGSIAGWYRAAKYTFDYWFGKEGRRKGATWDGPGPLWWYLALSSFTFFVAVPLLGLTMDIDSAVRLASYHVTVIGPNQTTFDTRTNFQVADQARNMWRQGLPTTPYLPTIFYAVESTQNVSATFYDDQILDIFQADVSGANPENRNITFFAGPNVADRVHGSAWGLLTSISCAPVNVYSGLELIKMTSKSEWAIPGFNSSIFKFLPIVDSDSSYNLGLPTPRGMFFNGSSFGISYEYLLALSDSVLNEVDGAQAEYNGLDVPIEGAFEIAFWQSLLPGYSRSETIEQMTTDPLVESSEGSLGYGVRCTLSSQTGFAALNAATRTFSDFVQAHSYLPDTEAASLDSANIIEFPGLLSIQWLAYTALTKYIPGFDAPPACLPAEVTPSFDPACNLFYSANLATGGEPYIANKTNTPRPLPILRQAVINPARMNLAAYKLFGSSAAAMMAYGPANWTTSNLTGVYDTSDLVTGVVPWQIVLALLVFWATITAVPQFFVFTEKRWSSTLTAFEMFRFGGEYRDAVQRFEGNEPPENKVLRQLPGMVGDLERTKTKGFVGLSWQPADPKKQYVNNRREAGLSKS